MRGPGIGDGKDEKANPRARASLPSIEVPLCSSMVQMLALAIHELATNAREHGALATNEGHLSVKWRIDTANGQSQIMVLDWVECGIDRQSRARLATATDAC